MNPSLAMDFEPVMADAASCVIVGWRVKQAGRVTVEAPDVVAAYWLARKAKRA